MATAFTTAIEAWDKRWATAEGRADWLDPESEIIALLPELKARGARTALDLGCGVGRHALFLAEHGLAVEAVDASAAGLAVVRETARARGISLGVREATADALPFDDGRFDFVLSWNVIYHGTLGDVGRRLAEIWWSDSIR
jgi:tellurite methyltransferase